MQNFEMNKKKKKKKNAWVSHFMDSLICLEIWIWMVTCSEVEKGKMMIVCVGVVEKNGGKDCYSYTVIEWG